MRWCLDGRPGSREGGEEKRGDGKRWEEVLLTLSTHRTSSLSLRIVQPAINAVFMEGVCAYSCYYIAHHSSALHPCPLSSYTSTPLVTPSQLQDTMEQVGLRSRIPQHIPTGQLSPGYLQSSFGHVASNSLWQIPQTSSSAPCFQRQVATAVYLRILTFIVEVSGER